MKKEFIQFNIYGLVKYCIFFFIINLNGLHRFYNNVIFFLDDFFDINSTQYRSSVRPYISVSGPLKIQTLSGNATEFAPGIIYMYGQIYLGYSDNDLIKLQGKNIKNDLSYNVCLGIDLERNITTTNQEADYILGSIDNTSILVGNKSGNIILNTKKSFSGDILLDSVSQINLNANSISVLGGIPKPGDGYTSILTIDSNGKLGIVLSSRVFKENIENVDFDEEFFDALKVVSYSYIGSKKKNLGFIAEEIAASDTKIKDYLVIYDQIGDILSIDHNGIIALNTYQIRNNKNKIRSLENEIMQLKSIISLQENIIAELQNNIFLEDKIINLELKSNIQAKEISELKNIISLLIN